MLRIFIALFATAVFAHPLPARAQEQSQAILVLDASGSMWGQIDGVAKITIAQQVIGGLLQSLPEDQLLGLTVYGARRKGDCTDIETLLAPTTDRDAIAELVNRIKPRGKTPMTDAVIAAAEALKYTEERATVILISDGIETCNPDPCSAARLLEQTGVDFTAHVIGFNVSDQAALVQMQCLADETGGLFRTASNADELAEALQEISEPEPVNITFRVIEGEEGPEITEGLIWSLSQDGAGVIFENDPNPARTQTMLQGTGSVEVMRLADESYADAVFTVGDEDMVVTLVLPKLLPSATLEAPGKVLAGDTFPVEWTGPVDSGTVIALADPDQQVGFQQSYFYLDQQIDNTAMMVAPTQPGTYELRYLTGLGSDMDQLARRQIEVAAFDFTITAAPTAAIGSDVEVQWRVPSPGKFVISLAQAGADASAYEKYVYASSFADGTATFTLPATPGSYEFRLLDALDEGNILARLEIEITDEIASIDAPEQVEIGETFMVTWEGPNKQLYGRGDYIAIAEPDMNPAKEVTYAYTSDSQGNAVRMIAPTTPGTYELRYILNDNDNRILVRRALVVVPVAASVSFDGPAEAGGKLAVTWQGPAREINGGGDYIAIAEPGMSASDAVTYTYTNNSAANVATLDVPTTPGTYELRYVLNGPQDVVLARRELEVIAVSASLTFDAPGKAGGRLAVTWSGPGGEDYIAIAAPGMRVEDEITYAYVKNSNGNVAALQLPTTPGTYEVRYVQKGNPKQVLASSPIVVEPVQANLKFRTPAPAGGTLVVEWQGPGSASFGDSDFIAVAMPGSAAGKTESYAYVKNSQGNVVELTLPDPPGTYELRYVLNGVRDRVLAAEPLNIVPLRATLEAADSAAPGDPVKVTWTGPAYPRDTIVIAKPGSDAIEAFASVAGGNIVTLYAPATKGKYEIRYLYAPLNQVVTTRVLIVE